jgi:lipoate---protein ligase
VRRVTSVVIEERRGTAEELHAHDPFADGPPARPALWVCDVVSPAIVLGSRQKADLLDLAACRASGYDVVTRRSGGGAVLLEPGAVCWIDVVVPHGVAPDDVRGSMHWVGSIWQDALIALGADPHVLVVHDGDMTSTPWSDLVCFAGRGPGEVIAAGHKLVGLSQRRTRHGIRVQCQAHRTPLLDRMPRLFAVPTPDGVPAASAVLADVLDPPPQDAAVAAALATAMEHRITGM